MKRRTFIAGLGGAVAAWPLTARGQQGDRLQRIGVLLAGNESGNRNVPAFIQALANLGWADRHNVLVDVWWTRGDINRIRTFAQELVGLQPDIIVTNVTLAIVAVRRETPTIPIVFVYVTDPVASGIVARLDRPSGNITGFANYE